LYNNIRAICAGGGGDTVLIAICDDDKEQIRYLRSLLREWSKQKPFALEITEYESAEQYLFCRTEAPCDLLLLDIEMSGLSGMELAKRLRGSGDMLPIVFITGFSEYMSEGYDVEALHYLLKPVSPDKLYEVLDKYLNKHMKRSEEILVETEKGTAHISADSVVYIEAFGKKTRICGADNTFMDCEISLGEFARKNISGFVSPHRSYLVNLRFVREIERTAVVLDNGKEIPLSRRLYAEFNRSFIAFYTN